MDKWTFTRILDKAARAGLIKGLLQDFRGGIVSLQYAEDTILFSSAETSHLVNLKHVIMWFETDITDESQFL
jgi:hypothetical protein